MQYVQQLIQYIQNQMPVLKQWAWRTYERHSSKNEWMTLLISANRPLMPRHDRGSVMS